MTVRSKRRTNRAARKRRHLRVRKRVRGTAQRPRLCVYRSARHIYGQIIDDDSGITLISASDLGSTAAAVTDDDGSGKQASARAVGRQLAQTAQDAGISTVVFDRAGYLYHGRVRALAEAARAGGLVF
ncbi:MAG: 50S ribosomal protein L18 [Chloroflexi bacterium]|nr:50S ribosomal protein L18 [Chloroflexota bacterium]MCY3587578.1 50S ribosomal protein L18 [Chloroflexota bacterium]MCY3686598.1 50S ribosomal protein L18 [Chloroflexota bacterium]MDE2707986.1 50S ribosomal protein L18 [Chloroflexota bacterium]